MKEIIDIVNNNIGLTESRDTNSNLKILLNDLGLNVFDFNTVYIEEKLENLNEYSNILNTFNYLIFTTPLAVELFFSYLEKNEYVKLLKDINYCAIGKLTNKKLLEHDINVLICAKEFTQNDLFEKMKNILKKDDQVLVIKSFVEFDDLEIRLKQLKTLSNNIKQINLYSEILKSKQDFNIDNIDTLIYTNPKEVKNMIAIFGLESLKNKKNIAIGITTAKVLSENGLNAFVCKGHSKHLLDELVKYIR